MDHIALSRWADVILIAPATANTISKLAQGTTDDLASTVVLASNKEIYLAEIQRDISQVVYTNLKDFKIEIPKNYVGGSGGKMTSNLDVITSFAALATMSAADQAKLVAKLNETS